VRGEAIHSQEELQRCLATRGFQVAQPTLSRDLRDLGLAKTPNGYVAPDSGGVFPVPPPAREQRESRLDGVLRAHVRSIATAHTLVVVKTPPAAAHPVGLAIDEAELPEVVGSVAGDDTVFLATTSPEIAGRLAARLTEILERRRTGRRSRS
jgi:transcriptional regulator of arginine metabolism